MPRLPDYTDLGQRPMPQSRRGVVANPRAGMVGEALAGLGGTMAETGEAILDRQDRAALASARTMVLAADVRLRRELADDPDHASWSAHYAAGMKAARTQAMGLIHNSSDRRLFEQESEIDQLRGASELDRTARKYRFDEDLASLQQAARLAPDEATRTAVFDTVKEHFAAAHANGDLDPERATALRQDWVRNYVAARVGAVPSTDGRPGNIEAELTDLSPVVSGGAPETFPLEEAISRASAPLGPDTNAFGPTMIRSRLPQADEFVERTPEGTEIYERPDGTHYELLKDGSVLDIITVSGRPSAYARQIRAAIARGATRIGPVPGWRQPAVKGQTGANGRPFSDGRYSIDGRERWRTYPGGRGKKHTGIDIPGNPGDPVYAAASGVVVDRTNISGYGEVVLIDHMDGTTTMSAHLGSRLVRPGDRVRIGDVIGTMGNSGNAGNQGTHLHFEAIVTNGNSIKRKLNPTEWIEQGRMR